MFSLYTKTVYFEQPHAIYLRTVYLKTTTISLEVINFNKAPPHPIHAPLIYARTVSPDPPSYSRGVSCNPFSPYFCWLIGTRRLIYAAPHVRPRVYVNSKYTERRRWWGLDAVCVCVCVWRVVFFFSNHEATWCGQWVGKDLEDGFSFVRGVRSFCHRWL